MEKVQGVELNCGLCKRTQRVYTPNHSKEEAQVLAEVMDGTSSIFIYPPKPDRSDCLPGNMGRCADCAAVGNLGVFTCKLFGYDEPATADVIKDAVTIEIGPDEVIIVRQPFDPAAQLYDAAQANAAVFAKSKTADEYAAATGVSREQAVNEMAETIAAEVRATSDGKPPRPGFENAPAPAPLKENGQHEAYWVLSPEERAKGFVRPVRRSYKHVGMPGPKHALRDLTAEEHERYSSKKFGYVKFEPNPDDASGYNGRFWTQAELDRVGKGCGTITTMSQAIAETYARNPQFYGSTFCCGCGKHLPVGPIGEFVWVLGAAEFVTTVRVGT